jgi:hypothetical protein
MALASFCNAKDHTAFCIIPPPQTSILYPGSYSVIIKEKKEKEKFR